MLNHLMMSFCSTRKSIIERTIRDKLVKIKFCEDSNVKEVTIGTNSKTINNIKYSTFPLNIINFNASPFSPQ